MDKKLISVTADDVIRVLKEAFDLDPTAIQILIDHRVPCNEALADHPTIQVGTAENWRKYRPKSHNLPKNAVHTIGLLGLLNGVFGKPDGGPIAGAYDFICDFCGATNVPELDGKRSGDDCPLCVNGTIRLGPIFDFKNLWAPEKPKEDKE